MNFYRGKKVLITGGSSGIGLAAATLAAERGADVCIAARHADRNADAVAAIQARAKSEARALHVEMDVTSDDSAERATAEAVEQLGGLDVLINNAGYAHPGYFDKLPMEVFQDMLEVNYLGMVRVVHAALPHFLTGRGGHIANVSSMLGFMGMFGYTAYAGSKFAAAGFTASLRQELRPHGIAVSLCFPPTTETEGLARENEIKPPEAWAIEGTSRAFSAERVAKSLLAGIAKGKPEIVVGIDSWGIWFLQRLAPWLVRGVTDRILLKYLSKQAALPEQERAELTEPGDRAGAP